MKQFKINASQEECRAKLGLPKEQKIVVYTGHLYDWKGAGTLAEAARFLPSDIHIYLVGGTVSDNKKFNEKYKISNLHIVGWKKHEEIPFWLKAADLLVLPTSGKEKIGAEFTSPLKLFEYLASGTPIVASLIQSLQEIVQSNQVVFFQADNANDLAEKIRLSIIQQLGQLSQSAKILAERIAPNYSWNNRVETIIGFIKLKIDN